MYITYEQYKALYPNSAMTEADFNRYGFRAQRKVDDMTTGVDGIRKLEVAWPTDSYDAECVVRCLCDLTCQMQLVEEARNSGAPSTGSDGFVTASKVVTSVSSGAESISYASGNALSSAIRMAAGDVAKEAELYRSTIRSGLDGVRDANGVRLLFGGCYPIRLRG